MDDYSEEEMEAYRRAEERKYDQYVKEGKLKPGDTVFCYDPLITTKEEWDAYIKRKCDDLGLFLR